MSEELTTKDFETQLAEAEAATARYEEEARKTEVELAVKKRDLELLNYSVSRSDSFDAACATLNLTPYSKNAMLGLLQKGHVGVELVNDGGRCKVFVDREETSMAAALGRLKVAEPTHFKEQPFTAQPGDPDLEITARDQFRNEDHRVAYLKKYGLAKFTALRSRSSECYTGPATRLSREQYKELCPEERLRAQKELGLERFELLMAGKPVRERRW